MGLILWPNIHVIVHKAPLPTLKPPLVPKRPSLFHHPSPQLRQPSLPPPPAPHLTPNQLLPPLPTRHPHLPATLRFLSSPPPSSSLTSPTWPRHCSPNHFFSLLLLYSQLSSDQWRITPNISSCYGQGSGGFPNWNITLWFTNGFRRDYQTEYSRLVVLGRDLVKLTGLNTSFGVWTQVFFQGGFSTEYFIASVLQAVQAGSANGIFSWVCARDPGGIFLGPQDIIWCMQQAVLPNWIFINCWCLGWNWVFWK